MQRQDEFRYGTATTFMGGLFLGVLAAKILSPLVAMAYGDVRVRAGHDPFEGLIADHQRFRDLLEQMERADRVVWRIQLLLRLKRSLAAHAMAEEDVIYPMLQDEAGAKPDPTHLYAEHAAMKVLMFRLEKQAVTGDWSENVRALRELITGHARHEEEIDFPRLREILRKDTSIALARKLGREKALVL